MASTSSSSQPSWERIWNDSRPQLVSIQQSLAGRQHVTSRVMRVGKLDAELLDQELVQVLQDPLAKALSVVNVRRHCINSRASLRRKRERSLPSRVASSRS